MQFKARWIWIEGEANPWNYYLCARTAFDIDSVPDDAVLHITASTRYVVWLNGVRLGQGPVRAFPWKWRYDTYDLRDALRPGANSLAVLVLNYGIATFQSLPAPGGLLAQIEAGGKVLLGTDSTWKVSPHPAYKTQTPRITCQQAWTEVYDARLAGGDWTASGFDDGSWPHAVEIGPAGTGPWSELLPRDIPFLTEEPLYPVNVMQADVVSPPPRIWGFELRRNLLPGVEDANRHALCGFVAATLVAPGPADVTLYSPIPGNYVPGNLRVNGSDVERISGTRLPFENGSTFKFTLQAGENLLLWDVSGEYHSWTCAWVLESETDIKEGEWVTFGPFDSPQTPEFQKVWKASSWAELKAVSAVVKPLLPSEEHADQPFLETAYARPLRPLPSRPFAPLASASSDDAAIVGQPEGPTRILLDLGRMTVGLWEMEISDAPEGAVIDLAGFESIQDGKWDLAWGINNAFRYVTRRGPQFFHSVIRRGCRYLLLTVSHPDWQTNAPVRLRSIRTLQNTYPCVQRGAFACSDYLLNKAWEISQYTTRLCSEDTYVDCPTYEQTFWIGDSRNEGAVNHYVFGEYALSRRGLLLAAESLKRSPMVESQVPSGWQDIIPTFSLIWVLACEEYWRITGDREFLEAVYPAIVKQNDYCLQQISDDGLLWLKGWNLLDWAPLDTPGDGACTHISAWFIMCLQRHEAMAIALGREDETLPLHDARENLTAAINRHLWDESRGAYIDSIHADGSKSRTVSQQTNTIVLLSGCAPPERENAIKRLVVEAPEGVVPVGSPFFMFFTFQALAQLGRFDTILDLTRRWWGMMLDTGATTCWETFPGFEPLGRYTRSHCHAWSSAPAYFQSRYQLGVAPLTPGFSKAVVAPVLAGLDWAQGRVPTPHGEIAVEWRMGKDCFEMRVDFPEGIEGEVRVPREAAHFNNIETDGADLVQGEGAVLMLSAAPGATVRVRASAL